MFCENFISRKGMRLQCAASPRAELRSAANFFCYLIVTVFALAQARHRVTRLTFSYSISYDTFGDMRLLPYFLCGDLFPGLSGAITPVLARASVRKIAGVSWSRKLLR